VHQSRAACGPTSWQAFAYYDPRCSSWRTSPRFAGKAEVSTVYSATWPKRGMTRYGVPSAPPTSAPHTDANACSCSPGPAPDAADPAGPRRRQPRSGGPSAASRWWAPSEPARRGGRGDEAAATTRTPHCEPNSTARGPSSRSTRVPGLGATHDKSSSTNLDL
jgi:hypothetical protein